MSNVITEIKKLLGMEIKLEQMALDNGTVIEAEMFEAGQAVFIVNGEDRVALPVGEYTLDNGKILVVAVEGEIAEIKEAATEEVETPEVEVEVEQAAEPTPATAKKVIESTVRESHFSQEDVDALNLQIENLKTELASMKSVETFEEKTELSAEPLTHNPDAKPNVEKVLFSQNRVMTTFDRVMNKIAN
jgi:hypothetical protein